MNIMAQVSLEKKINMSYSAEELLVTCFFDGVSCDARSGKEAALSARGFLHAPAAQLWVLGRKSALLIDLALWKTAYTGAGL